MLRIMCVTLYVKSKIVQVTQAFAEMIFKHGFVHCDPHAANMMVRPLPSNKWNIFGKKLFLHLAYDLCAYMVQFCA